MEQILHKDNLNKVYKKVKSNKGTGGVGGMSADERLGFLKDNRKHLIQQIKDGKYQSNPVRRGEIPKETKGEFRKLGVPTIVDRVFQQAITQVTWFYVNSKEMNVDEKNITDIVMYSIL